MNVKTAHVVSIIVALKCVLSVCARSFSYGHACKRLRQWHQFHGTAQHSTAHRNATRNDLYSKENRSVSCCIVRYTTIRSDPMCSVSIPFSVCPYHSFFFFFSLVFLMRTHILVRHRTILKYCKRARQIHHTFECRKHTE